MNIIVEPEGLLSIEGVEGVTLFRIADTFLSDKEQGRAFLLHSGGQIEAPASSSMLGTAKKYKDGTKLKIKGREFILTHSTLYYSEKAKWKLEACINPIEQNGGCHCEVIIPFNFG